MTKRRKDNNKEDKKDIIDLINSKGYKEPHKPKNNFIAAKKESTGKYGFLDTEYNEASDFVYDTFSYVQDDGHVLARKGKTYGFLTYDNEPAKLVENGIFKPYNNMFKTKTLGYYLTSKRIGARKYLFGFVHYSGKPITIQGEKEAFKFQYGFKYMNKKKEVVNDFYLVDPKTKLKYIAKNKKLVLL